jgi:hypothetical protein
MNPRIRIALLPAMRALGRAPYAGAFAKVDLNQLICAAGFDIIATESHANQGQ